MLGFLSLSNTPDEGTREKMSPLLVYSSHLPYLSCRLESPRIETIDVTWRVHVCVCF